MRCRICKSDRLYKFLSLGAQPHCNHFLKEEELAAEPPFYPLDLYFCQDCALVQLAYTVPPELMFRDYPYVSGTTSTLSEHFRQLARQTVERFHLSPQSLVVDIGSNDGTLLKGYRALGMRTLGVDPARNVAQIARRDGIETWPEFFGRDLAVQIVKEKGKAQLVTAAGVFYHLPNLDDFVEGVRLLLEDDGVFVVQAIYLLDMLEKNSFDNIYHEHLCYYSLRPLTILFHRFDMEVFDVQRIDIHGGSLRLFVRKGITGEVQASVHSLLALEEQRGLYSLDTHRQFASRVVALREHLVSLLKELKSQGKRIAAYGAPAKGNTMLNYCQIGTDLLDYAIEKNPLKQGLYTPGMHIPVIPEEEARGSPPDYYLILPWNFLDEFLHKERDYLEHGGKFIVPVPEPRIIDAWQQAQKGPLSAHAL